MEENSANNYVVGENFGQKENAQSSPKNTLNITPKVSHANVRPTQ